jgi:hypothetical protein
MKNDVTTGLASKINEAHAEAVQAAQSALLHAREAGRLLIEAKAALPHGAWAEWLRENVSFSHRTANAYMRVADRWEEIQANSQSSANLSIDGALKLLAAPREEEPELAEDGEPDWLPAPGQIAIGTTPGLAFWIVPSAEHERFYYYTIFREDADGSEAVVGSVRPVRDVALVQFIDVHLDEDLPLAALEWTSVTMIARDADGVQNPAPEIAGWTYNEIIFDSHEDYMQRHVLGRDLAHIERRIDYGLERAEAARAGLGEIRDRKLYREEHATFDAYLASLGPDAEPLLAHLNETGGF